MENESTQPQPVNCSELLTWAERVDELPPDWFAALTLNPKRLPIDDLPFDTPSRQHLTVCAPCRNEVYECLEARVLLQWAFCPEIEEVFVWLTGAPDPRLENHLRQCAACAGQMERMAWLAEAAGRLTSGEIAEKLEAAQARECTQPPDRAAKPAAAETGANVWEHFVQWLVEELRPILAEPVASLAGGGLGWRLLTRVRGAIGISLADLTGRLSLEDQLTLTRESGLIQCLLVKRAERAVLLQAGVSPAESNRRFKAVFHHGDEPILTLATEDGTLCLTEENIRKLQMAGANHLEVVVEPHVADPSP